MDKLGRYYYAGNLHHYNDVFTICRDDTTHLDQQGNNEADWKEYRIFYGKWDTPNNSSAYLHVQEVENPGYTTLHVENPYLQVQ